MYRQFELRRKAEKRPALARKAADSPVSCFSSALNIPSRFSLLVMDESEKRDAANVFNSIPAQFREDRCALSSVPDNSNPRFVSPIQRAHINVQATPERPGREILLDLSRDLQARVDEIALRLETRF